MKSNVKRGKKMDCRNCIYFPCFKTVCNIGNKSGCEDYKSIITYELENVDKKIEQEKLK